ncbi:MAG: EAL domain-containing protein [Actinobacteria bacterium]|nr:EAL domain-containing protein [Actinomycetota bacterium]
MADQPPQTDARNGSDASLPDSGASPWASPLGRWLRGLIDDSTTVLPSLSSVIETARRELERSSALGVLFVRFEQWGLAVEMFGWRDLQKVYELGSGIAMDMVGDGLRQVDLPADLGLRGEGFAIVLSGPRQAARLEVDVVDMVAERVASLVRERLAGNLAPELLERISVEVGAGMVFRPGTDETLEDALVAGLVTADSEARRKQDEHLLELGDRLEEVIEEGRIVPLFQPVADVESQRIVAFDAQIQGPFYLNLRLGDVLLDVAARTGLRHRVLDLYHHRALESAEDGVGGVELLILRAASSDLLESAVRVLSLLYRRGAARMTPANVLFMVDAAELADRFPTGLAVWHSVADMGFRLGVDLAPNRPLPLDYIRELRPYLIRVSGRNVRALHRHQDEFEFLLMLCRFAARGDMHVLAADCTDRREFVALRRAGVSYLQGEFVAPCFTSPVRPELTLP